MSNPPEPASAAGQLSCTICRVKKLKCDRAKPRCGRCTKLDAECRYPTSRQNQTGRRRRVQTLESRIAQLEDLLKQGLNANAYSHEVTNQNFAGNDAAPLGFGSVNQVNLYPVGDFVEADHLSSPEEEPSTDLLMELTAVYFSRFDQASPMLHQSRYMESLLLPPATTSPLCLRYIIIALAMLASESHKDMAVSFYQKSRNLAEANEMLGADHEFITLAHAQCWCLMSYFEAEQGSFARASISLSRSSRIAQVLGLHRLGSDAAHSQDMMNASDVIDLEERRRTWWVIYICDRFTCATTGWLAQIDDRDVTTLLPSSDEAFAAGTQENTNTLAASFTDQQHNYSSFAGRVMAAYIFHRALQHATRGVQPQNDDADIKNGSYWTQLRRIDSELVIMHMSLPQNLKLPRNFRCQNAIFVNATIHTATVCVLRSAIWKCQQLMYPEATTLQYKARLLPAAQEITNAVRLSLDLQALMQNPLVLFSVYIAALVFLDDVMADNAATESQASLDVLLHIMVNVGDANPVASAMALELSDEMEKGGLHSSAIQKIKVLHSASPGMQQPFPILSQGNALSLQTVLRNPPGPTSDSQPSLPTGTNFGTELFDNMDMALQVENQCIADPSCCGKEGGACNFFTPEDGAVP